MSNGGVRPFHEIVNDSEEYDRLVSLLRNSWDKAIDKTLPFKCPHIEIVEIVLLTSTVRECKYCKEVIK